MKRTISLLLILTLCLCACIAKDDATEEPKIHVSEPIEQVMYTVGFHKKDCELAAEFDRILGEVMEDGTASMLCETHMKEDLICKEPIPANILRDDDGSLARVREAGKIIIGFHKQSQPMTWIDASDTTVGFDAELAREIGRRMGLAIEFKVIDRKRTDIALENREVDAVFSAFEYSDERADKFNLTRTYFTTSLVIVSPEDAPIDAVSALTEKKISVAEYTFAERYATTVNADVFTCSYNTNAYSRLKDNKCAAIIVDMPYALYLKQGHKK